MSLDLLTSADAVHAAMDEYDALGADAFLAAHGYGRARSYFVIRNGRSYDSKAIAGVAVGKQFPGRGALRSGDFSGGEATVRAKLESLGFRVEANMGNATFGAAEALSQIVAAWGPTTTPPGKYLAAWRTPQGREFALQLEQQSARVWVEAEPPVTPGLTSERYDGKETRHTYLKAGAPRLAEPNTAWRVVVASPDALQALIDWYQHLALESLDAAELEAMKVTFLREMPSFETFEVPGETYLREERTYKDDLCRLFAELIAPILERPMSGDDEATSLTKAWGEVLTGKVGPAQKPQNLISWQGVARVRQLAGDEATAFGSALYALLVGVEPPKARLAAFTDKAGAILKAAGATGASGIARLMGSCALMLQNPQEFIAIRTDLFEKAILRLKRQPFPTYSDEPGRISASLELAREVESHLRDRWAWVPKDMIDIQSFLWIALMYDQPSVAPPPSFAALTEEFLGQFAVARLGPFGETPPLWDTMDRLKTRLASFACVKQRPTLSPSWSLGKGVWATIPWIALMDSRVTNTTRDGYYVAFLVSRDLSRIHLTLMQGTASTVDENGRESGAAILRAKSEAFRLQVPELAQHGFRLDGDIALGAEGWRGRSYEVATIAHVPLVATELPTDEELEALLEPLLAAYDHLVEGSPTAVEFPAVTESQAPPAAYTIEQAMDGLFMDQAEFERLLNVWRPKLNMVLQGAPGVGKTFIAQRLAYALMGQKDPSRVEMIQFHQSYGYEDFIQGYRPTEAGGFRLQDGVFFRFCQRAAEDPTRPYVFIIDEINRGNLSKIFGELMLLIEHDKRSPTYAARLAYSSEADPPFYLPKKLHILGMMNTADRSLSLVDYALRRRFSFVTLEPAFSSPRFVAHLQERGMQLDIIRAITEGMGSLNAAIAEDKVNLGPGFRIGHSFFVPGDGQPMDRAWFEQVVETEIRPLLMEYWFDESAKAGDWCVKLLGRP